MGEEDEIQKQIEFLQKQLKEKQEAGQKAGELNPIYNSLDLKFIKKISIFNLVGAFLGVLILLLMVISALM